VHQTLNTKVGDLKPTYNFHKGYLGFFSLDFSQQVCQLGMPPNCREQEVLTFEQVFHLFPLKIEMSIYMKVVSLNKLDNFHKGRFLSV
jgi:hypothetical protein